MVAGVEFSDLNWIGLAAAFAFSMVLGFIWFNCKTPMGKVWMRGEGLDPDNLPPVPAGKMVQSMLIMVVGSFLMFFVMAHTFIAYQDSYSYDCREDNSLKGCDGDVWELTWMDGVMGGLFTWAGFFLPLNLGAVAWQRKSWGYALNTTAYYLIILVVGGLFLALL